MEVILFIKSAFLPGVILFMKQSIPIVIRPAVDNIADRNFIVSLLGELFELEQDFQPDAPKQAIAVKMFLRHPYAKIFIAESNRQPAGFCIVSMQISTAEGGWSGEIEDLAVSPQFRRHGVAQALLRAAENWSYDNGALRMRLNCDEQNLAARELYKKLGWQKSHLFIMFHHQ